MKVFVTLLVLFVCLIGRAQNKAETSLFLKKDPSNYLSEIESESGNLFTKLGHHGPAVENQWLGFRIYFNKKVAIDVYSKAKPGLKIRDKNGILQKKNSKKAGAQIITK